MAGRALLAAVALASSRGPGAEAFNEAPKFLIVSSAATHQVAYMPLFKSKRSSSTAGANGTRSALKVLIGVGQGLTFPQGLAVDTYSRKLYVADPTLQKVVAYDLSVSGDELSVGEQVTVVDNVEVRAVALDSLGNLYFSEEPQEAIMRVAAGGGMATQPRVLYGSSTSAVSQPGGIYADNYQVYWVNKLDGTQVGALVRGTASPEVTNTEVANKTEVLSRNADKCYGVCVAMNNIFYTAETTYLYGLKRGGGDPVTVSADFDQPRGCAFDGDNTVYVADKVKNAIYSFPGAMQTLRADYPLQKVVDLEGAFGVAVYSAPEWSRGAAGGGPRLPSFSILSVFLLLVL